MSNKKTMVFFLVFLFLIAVGASFFTSSIALLKMVGMPINFETVKWNTFIDTYQLYSGQKSHQKYLLAGIAGGLAPLIIYLAFIILLIIGLKPKKTLHGAARFATDMDLAKSGLFPTKNKKSSTAVLIGKMDKGRYKGQYIQYMGQQFLMLYAPTRSGKGVGIVIPNCLYYFESLVVLDIKLENFISTAGHRKDKLQQEVFLFCPDGYLDSDDMKEKKLRSHRYNPLFYIRRDPINRFGDLTKISSILFPLTGDKNDMWTDLSANVFNSLVLFLLDTESETITEDIEIEKDGSVHYEEHVKPKYKVTMSQVFDLSVPKNGTTLGDWFIQEIAVRNTDENKAAWNAYIASVQSGNENAVRPGLCLLSDDTVTLMRQFSQQKPEQQQNIMLTFNANMKMFANPVTAAATDGNDFDLRDVRRKRMTVYFGLAPAALNQYARLTNLFFSQLLNENVRTLPEHDSSLKYQCLMMLDEFTSMGCLDIIQVSLAFTAGYNMRFVFILQNQEQLFDEKKGYGKNGGNTILKNCAVELFYPPKEVDDSVKKMSETLGYYDMKVTSTSVSKGKSASKSTSTSIQKRALMLPQEIVELRDLKHASGMALREIVKSEFSRPFIANKIVYFDEPYFSERKKYAETHIPDISVLTIEQDELAKALHEMMLRDAGFIVEPDFD
ncbi:type IV secretory system conjugative DNA transfer family protein [Xenorhabdus bovienii]|uniref:type IV secretory system conjugative DNA transfer family protein n=1 Tax=Xenorhabdus bovienii TaxID=40576 RepID=UPI0023B30C7E|nr:type IV secretory system conjugative DNA transfer family protein [Xenorhabdus bovienii]MDE9544141.1 type IV secretory system conjugative DNA transfer family protein [Xenorhabdus bovienii]